MRIAIFLWLTLLLAACSESPSSGPATGTASASASTPSPNIATALKTADAGLGRRIYNFRCYFCHGYSGDAQTLASTYLDPRPRDFTNTSLDQLSREKMVAAITNGRPDTAMKGFAGILQPAEIEAVADFVRQEFMLAKARNTHYHTKENGWENHERYAAAFPFATGKITLDTPAESLTAEQRAGRQLFMSTCVSCHDRAKVKQNGAPWESHPLSYPRNGFSPGDSPKVDAITSATPYHLHDQPPKLTGLSVQERRGETLFQENCAFCHAADGTARNWIGSFLEPHPRDLTAPAFMKTVTRERLAGVIRNGLPGTSMPAWRSVLPEEDIQAVVAYIGKAFHPLAASPVPDGASLKKAQ